MTGEIDSKNDRPSPRGGLERLSFTRPVRRLDANVDPRNVHLFARLPVLPSVEAPGGLGSTAEYRT